MKAFKKSKSHMKNIGIIILIGLMFACKKDDENKVEVVSAKAGSDKIASTYDTVTLDGSSSTPNGSITYEWSFSSKPSGSSSILQESTTATPYFIPDTKGNYIIELTVSTDKESDTDEVTVSVEQGTTNTKEFNGEIASDTKWTNHVANPAIPDYVITGDVYINATLTIEPGVVIHVKENHAFYVNKGGAIESKGTSTEKIVFTSANEIGDIYWKGIMIKSSSSTNLLDYTEIKYAGNSNLAFSGTDYATAVGIEDGKLSITNSKISNSKAYGLFLHSGEINDFAQNAFEQNQDYSIRLNASQVGKLDDATTFSDAGSAVLIYGSSLNEASDVNWTALNGGARYYVEGWLYVDSYLSISAGAIFDIAEDMAIKVNSTGVIVADASEGSTIVFTSKRASSGVYWKGFWINSNDARNKFANVEVSYAGNSEFNFPGSNYAAAIGVENGKISLVNSTINNSKNHGLYLHSTSGDEGKLGDFTSNTFSDNKGHAIKLMANEVKQIDAATSFSGNGWNGVSIYNSDMRDQGEWVNLNGSAKYKVEGWVDVKTGLTINPGAELTFDEDVALVVKSTGHFIAKGASGNEIIFTSSNEPGQIRWAGIWIQSSDARNEIDYAIVNYAGGYEFQYAGPNHTTAIAGDDDDSPYLTLTNSTVKNSGSYAVYWEGGTINDIEGVSANNTFIDNAQTPDIYTP